MSVPFSNADAYERLMGRWSARLAPRFLEFAAPPREGEFLDVGCGTGALVEAILLRAGNATVVGIDPSESFLEHARGQFPGESVSFEVANVMSLPFGEGRFDASLSLLVFMFVPDPLLAAREMSRVTRREGVVAACVWDHRRLEMTALFWEEAIKLDPSAAVNRATSGMNYEGALKGVWIEAGFRNVEEVPLDMEMSYTSFNDYWEPFLGGNAPPGAYLARLPSEGRAALEGALRHRVLGDGLVDRPFTLGARAWAARGVVQR